MFVRHTATNLALTFSEEGAAAQAGRMASGPGSPVYYSGTDGPGTENLPTLSLQAPAQFHASLVSPTSTDKVPLALIQHQDKGAVTYGGSSPIAL